MKALRTCSFIGVLSLFWTPAATGQNTKATKVQIEGHVYEPATLEPTTKRINRLTLPDGFHVAKFAALVNPRMIAVADDGTVYVTQREPGTLTLLRDTNGDGVVDVQKVVAEKNQLHGLTIKDGKMYLATVKEVLVADIKPDGTLSELRTVIDDLPDGGQHPNRTLAFGPDGMLYVTVGSTCNACKETNEESATVLRMQPDGGARQVFASGLRNTIGFGWHPASRRMFGMDHGTDWLGDVEQPEELNELIEYARYGWPYVYAASKFNPQDEPPQAFTHEMWAQRSKEPVLLYTSHSAPMQMVFYTGDQFPAEYTHDAFVAMHGSWNRKPPSGYEVARVKFDQDGKPVRIEPFLTGFLVKGGAAGDDDGQFGRPAGVAVAKDGALLVSDDTNNIIYRVSYDAGHSQTTAADKNQRRLSFPDDVTFELFDAQADSPITVSSAAFTHNQPIPERHSNYGQDASPALSWTGIPEETRSVVVMVEDPDASSPKPFVHWLVANLPPTTTELPAALAKTEQLTQIGGAVQGSNHTGRTGYYGPHPPAGEPAHQYHFQVFALDTTLELPPGFTRQALLDAMQGHVLAKGQLIGAYQRQQDAL